ncbi:MAG: tyrosine-type recombinase/integrase, partial [Candidatus Omnitrophica bacterium]|nr:tyrosine-type recombinase/integrase [Candidatus Omnitrophota bacterium]
LRNRAMISIMLGGGLRCEEVVSLTIGDLDWMVGKLHIKNGKGAKDRVLWLNEKTLDDLRAWRESRAKVVGSDGPKEILFSTLKGKKVHPSYLRQMIPRMAKRAGIEKRVYPHLLRHTFATWLYKQDRNLRLTQTALGHSSIQTTEIYTHLVNNELEDALRNYQIGGGGKG